MTTQVLAATISNAPATGLSPSWVLAFHAPDWGGYDSPPDITELGDGNYSFTEPSGIKFVGLIDFGATADCRFAVYSSDGYEGFGATDSSGVLLAGVTPRWERWRRSVEDDDDSGEPAFAELGSGLYVFTHADRGLHAAGLIDLGAGADPRYLQWDNGRTRAGLGPVLTGIGAGQGGLGFGLD